LPPPDYFDFKEQTVSNGVLSNFVGAGFIFCGGLSSDLFVPSGVQMERVQEYLPSELTYINVWKGLAAYAHPTVEAKETEMEIVFHWLDRTFGAFLAVPMWDVSRAFDELDDRKASGVYWRQTIGSQKGDVKSLYSGEQLIQFFETHTPVYSSSLKPELRMVGVDGQVKPARLFMPMPTEMAQVGNFLFGAQNESLSRNNLKHPITIGLQIPGVPLILLYDRLRAKNNQHCNDADGSKYDANFANFLAVLCRDLRKRYLPKQFHAMVDRYYNATYCSYVDVLGNIVILNHQKSGQTNTAMDNSLGSCACMYLAAIRKGWTYEQFYERIEFFVNGDDLIFSSNDESFDMTYVADVYRSWGCYLDSDSPHFKELSLCSYLGTNPTVRTVGDQLVPLYSFRTSKIVSSFSWFRKGTTMDDHLSKFAALVLLSYGDEQLYAETTELVRNWVVLQQSYGVVFSVQSFASLMAFVNDPWACFLVYTGLDLLLNQKRDLRFVLEALEF